GGAASAASASTSVSTCARGILTREMTMAARERRVVVMSPSILHGTLTTPPSGEFAMTQPGTKDQRAVPHLADPDKNPSFTRGVFEGDLLEDLVFPFPEP